jgi:cytochrome c peroxidase
MSATVKNDQAFHAARRSPHAWAQRAARMIRLAVTGFLLAQSTWTGAATADPYARPREVPTPADNKLTPARAELGKSLFFDPRLSKSNWISCATCHNPSLGWSDGLPTGFGHNMARLSRATPTILNAAYNPIQMWDGRKATLEDQALGPIEAEQEMNLSIEELIARLSRISGYVKLFGQKTTTLATRRLK